MMNCPQCGASYADDMAFCLEDGTALMPAANDQPTLVIPSASIDTQVSSSPLRKGVSPVFAYLTVALLALIAGGGIVWFIFGSKGEERAANVQTTPTGNSPEPVKTSNPGARQMPLPVMDEQAARELLSNWEKVQDSRNFAAYRDLYDTSFQGIKRTSKGTTHSYNYQQWLADRRKMMGQAFMEVGVDNQRVTLDGETAEVQFDQTFTMPGYADYGPKVMRLKMTAAGPKIVYEELKSATLVK